MSKNIFKSKNTLDPESSPSAEELLKDGKVNEIPTGTGLYHTKTMGPEYNYKNATNEKIIKHVGSYIVLGTDRPSSITSGYGAKGAQNANSIDLVVGRMASANDGDGPFPGTLVDSNFAADAARIYISQLTKIDKNFGIAKTLMNTAIGRGRSGIGIKADGVRIIGREGVKIVTGAGQNFTGYPKGETNSLGGKLQAAPPIELIAGNFTGSRKIPGGSFLKSQRIKALQPIPLGDNTKDALLELSSIVDEIWSALFNFAVLQLSVNTSMGISPFAWQGATVAAASPIHISYVMNSLYHTRVNKAMWELNYLQPTGCKYICSKNVRTT